MERTLDSLVYSLKRYEGIKPGLEFRATTLEEAIGWQEELRAAVIEAMGGFPEDKCPLDPEIVERFETPYYVRETVLFQSRSELTVFSYMLIPKGFKAPGPCLIAIPGHGRGVDSIVGYKEDGSMREWGEWGEYQKDFALQAVSHGFAVLAVEQLGFGHRRDEMARRGGPEISSCQPASGAALLLGETMAGWRVWDIVRAVDYLETRSEIDPKRIGAVGISGGGMTTFFSASIDRRIVAAFVSGYFNLFRESIFSISHCIDNYIPGILKKAEMPDIGGLIAPRPLFIESGTKDPIFPVEATRKAFLRLQEIYRVFGAEDRLGLHIFEGDHQFDGREGFPFLKKWLC